MQPVYSMHPRQHTAFAQVGHLLGGLCLLSLCVVPAHAGGPDPATVAAVARCRSDPTATDCRLTVAAMKALAKEPRLAHVNLGLTVHDHVITLWGFVPTSELRTLAEKRLLDVPGVGRVLNQLQLPPGTPNDGQPAPPRPVERTIPSGAPAPDGPLPPDVPRPLRDMGEASMLAQGQASPNAAAPTRVTARPIITNMEPPLAELPTAAAPLPSANEKAILALMQGDVRYQNLRVEIKPGLVILHGRVFSWDDLRLLATEIARLPGAHRVSLDDVRTSP
jgi:hypothetical protein